MPFLSNEWDTSMYGILLFARVDVWNKDLLLLNREVCNSDGMDLVVERAIPLLADSNLGKPALIMLQWCGVFTQRSYYLN